MLRTNTKRQRQRLSQPLITAIHDLYALAISSIKPLRFLPVKLVALPLPSVDSILATTLSTGDAAQRQDRVQFLGGHSREVHCVS
jgi:hypothetical protein